MATWTVEQRVEIWYKTTVEAETPEQAIRVADGEGDWQRKDDSEWQDDYWLMNEETHAQFTCLNGNMIQEE